MYQIFWQPAPRTSKTITDDGKQSKTDTNVKTIRSSRRQKAWESGNVDYRGADRFVNIQRMIDEAINRVNDLSVNEEQRLDDERRRAWEAGQIDYEGIDKFANIQRKLDSELGNTSKEHTDKSTYDGRNGAPMARPASNDSEARRRAWEAGQIDYEGVDKFDNIQRKLDAETKNIDEKTASELQEISERRRRAWEAGQIDYKGVDCFANIQRKLDEALTAKPSREPPQKKKSKQTKSSKLNQSNAPSDGSSGTATLVVDDDPYRTPMTSKPARAAAMLTRQVQRKLGSSKLKSSLKPLYRIPVNNGQQIKG